MANAPGRRFRPKPAQTRRNQPAFERKLAFYRQIARATVLNLIPKTGPRYLYDLAAVYPSRTGKGLRAALCLATCQALGGNARRAVKNAGVIELFHNAFLIYDDIQDGSQQRRCAPALYREQGVPIAINVGNATNFLALQSLMQNRETLGPMLSWALMTETELMMRHTIEGQAIELGWIRDNASNLDASDYLHMCLKKTAWYSFIYPMRVGALIALGGRLEPEQFRRFGWYMGAAFQIQDDILNLVGTYKNYGKEIGGDLWEGKRTLMLINLQRLCSAKERSALRSFLGKHREERTDTELVWLYDLMKHYGVIEQARKSAQQLAGGALLEALTAFRGVPDSAEKQFILEMVLYIINRDR